jgi:hypothetical protein
VVCWPVTGKSPVFRAISSIILKSSQIGLYGLLYLLLLFWNIVAFSASGGIIVLVVRILIFENGLCAKRSMAGLPAFCKKVLMGRWLKVYTVPP